MLYVTGMTGHSGKYFLDRLERERYKGRILCVVRPSSNNNIIDKSSLDIKKVVGDIGDIDFLNRTMENCNIILHIAGIGHSFNIVNAAIKNKVEWVILIHTTGMYSKFKSASSKYVQIEDAILKFRGKGIGITILRPTMIYGSMRDHNISKLIKYLDTHKFFPIFGLGKNLIQPVHARDLGNAYYNIILNKDKTFNKEYNLSGGDEIQYINLCKEISNNLHKNNVFIKIPLWLSLFAVKVYNLISKSTFISEEQVLRMKEDRVFNHSNAILDFQYSPISLKDGIIEEINVYKNSSNK